MNEKMKPMYAMTEKEIIDEISIVQEGIVLKCRELQEKNFDMVMVDKTIKEYETDIPLYSMNKKELVIYLRDKHKVYSRICSYLNSIPEVYDARDMDSLINSYKKECELNKEVELSISRHTVKTKETVRLDSFMDNYRKYRQLQRNTYPKKEIELESNALELLRSSILNNNS